jgi:predicted Zn finger-like uncharacterized protein
MNVQCEKCGTRYNLDDTKVKPGETKVRCSQCQHVFTVPHPLTLNEEEIFSETDEKVEDAFMKEWAQEIASQPPQVPEQSIPTALNEGPPPRAFVPPSAEEPLLREEAPLEKVPIEEAPVAIEEAPVEEAPVAVEEAPVEKEQVTEPASQGEEIFPVSPVSMEEVPAKKERKTSTAFLIIMLLLLIGAISLYFWSNKTQGSIPAFEYIYEKLYNLMEGGKAQKVFPVAPRGSEYILEGGTVYVIQGKIANRSKETKKFVKVQASLFDKTGKVVATSTGYCGVTITNERIKNSTYESLKTSFGFVAPARARPVPSQQSLPFTIIFFSPPGGATQYQVEISEVGESV